MIRTLIVDDSAIVRAMLKEVMENDNRFEVVETADNGLKAIMANNTFKPELIVMDINMPIMDGIEATSRIVKESNNLPPAIIAFTTEDTLKIGFKCLEAGALDVIKKPDLALMSTEDLKQFCNKLYYIALKHKKINDKINSNKKEKDSNNQEIKKVNISLQVDKTNKKPATIIDKNEQKINSVGHYNILLIGASTGGPGAIQTVLKGLGKNFPLPILITQHIDSLFDEQFSSWLNSTTDINVSLACNNTVPEPSCAYIAPANKHLTIKPLKDKKCIIELNEDPPMHFLRPAVDKMFISAANVFHRHVLAVLLTGMGRDGEDGCIAIKNEGGFTICQDETSCIVYGMPKAAIEAGGADIVLSLEHIAPFIKKKVGF